MNDDTIERLGRLYTSAVHDVLRGLGHERCVLPPSIRPIEPGTTLCTSSAPVMSGLKFIPTPHRLLSPGVMTL